MSVNSLVTLHYLWICIIAYNRFYHTNHVRRFKLKRPFHQGIKDKENEYKVGDIFIDLCSHLVNFLLQTLYTECMLHTTAYRFPGILRWFEVIETDVVGSFFTSLHTRKSTRPLLRVTQGLYLITVYSL